MSQELDTAWRSFCGDPGGGNFEPFYERTRALVYSICFRILRDEEDAADALQAAYARLIAVTRSEEGPARQNEISKFVAKIAIREAENLRKRRGRHQAREVVMDRMPERMDAGASAREAASRSEVSRKLDHVLAALPDQYRVPVVLHYYHDMSHREIAEALERPINTVSSQIARGLKKLNPLTREAGLGEALVAFGGLIGVAELLSPPATLTAATVFGAAEAMLAAGGLAGGATVGAIGGASGGTMAGSAGVAAWKASLAGAILSTKGGIFASGIIVGTFLILAVAWTRLDHQKPNAAVQEGTHSIAVEKYSGSAGISGSDPSFSATSNEFDGSRIAEAQSGSAQNSQSGSSSKSDNSTSSKQSSSTVDDPSASTPNLTPPKIGAFLCASTSEGAPSNDNTDPMAGFARDYYIAQFVIPTLKGLGYDMYAVVEPGTEKNPALAAALKRYKLENKVINGADVDQLKKLDSVVSGLNSRIPEEVVDAIMAAVQSGVGIFVYGNFGSKSPGNSDKLRDFLGLSQTPENFRVWQQNVAIEVVAPEELLLGALSPGLKLEMTMLCGYTGMVDGTPMLAVPDLDPNFCPFYVRQYGKGRMGVMQPFLNPGAIDIKPIRDALQFGANWCCKRPLDMDWRTVKRPETSIVSGDGATSATESPKPLVKVGLVLSHVSRDRGNFADGIGEDYYKTVGALIVNLEVAGGVVSVILDNNEKDDEATRRMIQDSRLAETAINWNEAEKLKSLDVIVSFFNPDLSGGMIEAVYDAVRGGVGFVALGSTGVENPDDTPVLDALLGVDTSGGKPKQQSGEKSARWVEHPTYKGDAYKPGQAITVRGIVAYPGQPDGEPLLKLDGVGDICVGYTRKVAYGRVVAFPFSIFNINAAAASFVQSEGQGYLADAIHWAAEN